MDNRRPKKLLEQVRDAIRLKHYSIRTEESYVKWIIRFILFHNKKHPKDMGIREIEEFLSYLAVKKRVAASTQNQAYSAILFLYREVLKIQFDGEIDSIRAKKPRRLPTVLTKEETHRVINAMSGIHQLMVRLLYGSGLRLMECVRLRIEDIDFGYNQITVRDGKGQKDRVTMLPQKIKEDLKKHLQKVKQLHWKKNILT